jgi:CotS family spore coat protein
MYTEQRIEPWVHLMTPASPDRSAPEGSPPGRITGDGLNDQYVPPYVEAIAREVMTHYDMQVSGMTLITAKPDKGGAIWKIATNHGPRSIKVLHRTPQRSLFSVGAQDYLVGKGAKVPGLIPTRDGRKYVEAGGKLWIVTEWIEPLIPASKIDLAGAQALCRGLGEFHRLSRGYIPPLGAAYSSRLYRWPKYYEKNIEKIGWFRDIAQLYPEIESSRTLLAHIDMFEQQARDTYQLFKESPYNRMVALGDAHWGLVHQDYGWSNGQEGPGGVVWLIDLDGVSYDLPIRDLRKLIAGTMDDMGAWDPVWIRGMIAAYHEANPIDQETFDILMLDLAFPNEFYKHIKEIVYQPAAFMQLEMGPILARVLQVEASKGAALVELKQDRVNYPSGNYPEVVEPVYTAPVPSMPMGAARWSLGAAPLGQGTPVLVGPHGEVSGGASEAAGGAAIEPVAGAPASVAVPAPPMLSIPRVRRRRIVSRKLRRRRGRKASGAKTLLRKRRKLRVNRGLKKSGKALRSGKTLRSGKVQRSAKRRRTVRRVKMTRFVNGIRLIKFVRLGKAGKLLAQSKRSKERRKKNSLGRKAV